MRVVYLKCIKILKGVFLMDMLPGAIRVILDWFIMLLGTLFTFMEKKEETDTTEEA